MRLAVPGIESDFVNLMRRGGVDKNGQVALRIESIGPANLCRHCLQLIAKGDDLLGLAYRLFRGCSPTQRVVRSFFIRGTASAATQSACLHG